MLRGKSLLHRAAKCALGSRCAKVAVVLGAEAPRCRKELGRLPVEVVVNETWQRGLASSIRAGLAALDKARPTPRAAILMACDQPLVTPGLLVRIAETYRESGSPIVACAYAGTLGVPALFDRSLFGELRALKGDHGAKSVIQRHASEARSIEFDGGAVDVDSAEDVDRLGDT